ncbi:MAG: type II toxin-antitoxin system VapB family antitoxin [Puniceicoccales bacterium]|nr:type II toxin-antitoxin system VapB family antitoxin [Puniceicoccales bacterium]
MKTTLDIDDSLLGSVMQGGDYRSKAEAVNAALRELDRNRRFGDFVEKNSNLFSPEELAASVAPTYDVQRIRNASIPIFFAEDCDGQNTNPASPP